MPKEEYISVRRFVCIMLAILQCSLCLFRAPLCLKAEENKDPLNDHDLYARAAVLLDADSGRILYEKNGQDAMPMASTTKIMTCILTLETASLDDIVEVSGYAAGMPDVQLNIRKGEYYRLEDLLYSLMLESHNDSAVAIAEHVGGSVEGFAALMNEKAKAIGCENTFFVTPNGLDASADDISQDGTVVKRAHSTTAADLAAIMAYCITDSPQRDLFLKITRTASHSFCDRQKSQDGTFTEGSRRYTCNNHNAFLHMMDGALTGKTGFTGNAGYCYVGALRRGDCTYVIALLACGWPGNKTWKWKDARTLYQYGLDHYQKQVITKEPHPLPSIPVYDVADPNYRLDQVCAMQPVARIQEISMLLSKADSIEVREKLPAALKAPVERGEQLGTLDYYVNGSLVARMPVVASHTMRARTVGWYLRLVLLRYLNPFH